MRRMMRSRNLQKENGNNFAGLRGLLFNVCEKTWRRGFESRRCRHMGCGTARGGRLFCTQDNRRVRISCDPPLTLWVVPYKLRQVSSVSKYRSKFLFSLLRGTRLQLLLICAHSITESARGHGPRLVRVRILLGVPRGVEEWFLFALIPQRRGFESHPRYHMPD